MRQLYEDRKAVFYTLGRWSVEEDGTRLLLSGGAKREQRFQIVGADSLRMLDSLGRPIQSLLSYSLVRAAGVDPVGDTMRLHGTYIYMADAGRFTECLSGSAFPVAQVRANVPSSGRMARRGPRPARRYSSFSAATSRSGPPWKATGSWSMW